MDCLALHGGSPANFCDIGGGATTEAVKKAFELLVQDPNVKSIFVNVSFASCTSSCAALRSEPVTLMLDRSIQIFGGM